MADAIISRDDARAQGLKKFYTGPCRHGHLSERFVRDGKCIACVRETNSRSHANNLEARRARQLAWRTANADKVRAQQNAWTAANLDHVKSRKAAWHAKHVDRIKPHRLAYRAAKAKQIKAQQAAWQKANPDKVRARCHNRRAKVRMAEGRHTAEDIQRIHAAQKGRCALCSTKLGRRYHLDHIVPLKLGGSNWPRNIQLTCPNCNQRKSSLDPVEFMRSQGFLL